MFWRMAKVYDCDYRCIPGEPPEGESLPTFEHPCPGGPQGTGSPAGDWVPQYKTKIAKVLWYFLG